MKPKSKSKSNLPAQSKAVGEPVVDWLWNGFNAVVISYGQAGAGKSALLLGDEDSRPAFAGGGPPSTGPCHRERRGGGDDARRGGGGDLDDPNTSGGKEARAGGASWDAGFPREADGGGGLLQDILRALFDDVHAATAAAADDNDDAASNRGSPPRAAEGRDDGKTAPGRSRANSDTDALFCAASTPRRREGGSTKEGCRSSNRYAIALSAWELVGKTFTDLLAPPSVASVQTAAEGPMGRRSAQGGGNRAAGGGSSAIKGEGCRRSRKQGGCAKGAAAATAGGGAGGGGGGRGGSRGRSGSSDDSSGCVAGHSDGFVTVAAPTLSTALALVGVARRRSFAEGRRSRKRVPAEEGESGKEGRGVGGGGGGGAKAGGGRAGHVFFRVVVYSELEETVSTLHVVDLVGGWEVSHLFDDAHVCVCMYVCVCMFLFVDLGVWFCWGLQSVAFGVGEMLFISVVW